MKPSGKYALRLAWHGLRRAGVRAARDEGYVDTLVEFAFAWLFVLAPVFIGIVYGGITFYDYSTLANAVAVGARTLAINRMASNPCTLEEAALKAAATNLNTGQITIVESFPTPADGSATPTCANLQNAGDYATVSATYPCNLYFSKLGINICSMAQGTITNTSGTTITNCPSPYPYCISATTTVRIE